MAFKAKKVSDVVLPVQITVGGESFTCELRYLTPKHNTELAEQATTQKMNGETGRVEKVLDEAKFSELLFDAIVVRAVDLTPGIVEQMLELDGDSDPAPVDADGAVTDRAFLKFLWKEAPSRLFAGQVIRANERMLQMARLAKEVDTKNSDRSSAS